LLSGVGTQIETASQLASTLKSVVVARRTVVGGWRGFEHAGIFDLRNLWQQPQPFQPKAQFQPQLDAVEQPQAQPALFAALFARPTVLP
jgi:hypothetical protein